MKIDDLRRLADKIGIPLVTLEKDYAVTLLLAIMSKFTKISTVAFKGGTALKKSYYPESRFSEDLDFTCNEDISEELFEMLSYKIKEKSDVGFTEVKRMDTTKNSKKFSVKYLDYNRHPNSVKIDLSLRENVLIVAAERKIVHLYDEEIEEFTVPTMDVSEIMSEKIRAMIYTPRPRHLYDLWYLFGKGVNLNMDFVNKKLSFYDERFSLGKLDEGIITVKKDWEPDLRSILSNVPSYEQVRESVFSRVSKISS